MSWPWIGGERIDDGMCKGAAMTVLVGGYCSVVMCEASISIMRLPRSIFNRLPGVEIERIEARSGARYFVKQARLNDCIDVTFMCDEPSA